jgi:hypothetical protein
MVPETWNELVFNLVDLSPGAAKKRFRKAIKDAWGCCAYCGRHQDDSGGPLSMTLDHIRPRANGGSTLRSNLVPACRRCNLSKGSERSWRQWFERQTFFCQNRARLIEEWIQGTAEALYICSGWRQQMEGIRITSGEFKVTPGDGHPADH